MDRTEKTELVKSLVSDFNSSEVIVVAHYTGLNVSEMENLRVQMKQAGGQVKVAKNRLAKLALKETQNADISELFKGPTLVAYSNDPVTAPKIAVNFAKGNEKLVILGGAMGETELDADGIKSLASMPTLDELRAKIAGLLTRPSANIAAILQAPGGQVARVISAYSDKGEAA